MGYEQIIQLVKLKSLDEKASVRKSAVQLLCSVLNCRGNGLGYEKEDVATQVLIYLLGDTQVSVRMEAVKAMQELLNRFKESHQLAKIWWTSMLPLIHDVEGNSEELLLEQIFQLLIMPILQSASGEDYFVNRGTQINRTLLFFLGEYASSMHFGPVKACLNRAWRSFARNQNGQNVKFDGRQLVQVVQLLLCENQCSDCIRRGFWSLLTGLAEHWPKGIDWKSVKAEWDRNRNIIQVLQLIAVAGNDCPQDIRVQIGQQILPGLQQCQISCSFVRVYVAAMKYLGVGNPQWEVAALETIQHTLINFLSASNNQSCDEDKIVQCIGCLDALVSIASVKIPSQLSSFVQALTQHQIISNQNQQLQQDNIQMDQNYDENLQQQQQNQQQQNMEQNDEILQQQQSQNDEQQQNMEQNDQFLQQQQQNDELEQNVEQNDEFLQQQQYTEQQQQQQQQQTQYDQEYQQQSTQNQQQRCVPLKIRRCAWTAAGALCIADDELACKLVPLMIQELRENSDDGIRNNILVVLTDLCVKYTYLLDQHVLRLAECLQDPSLVVRMQALALLTYLLKRDYVKWNGPMFIKFLVTVVDDAHSIRSVSESLIRNALALTMMELSHCYFVEALYILNGCRDQCVSLSLVSSSQIEVGLSEEQQNAVVMAGKQNRGKRQSIYCVMLQIMNPLKKFAIQDKICKNVLARFVDQELSLTENEELLVDALTVLASKQVVTSVPPTTQNEAAAERVKSYAKTHLMEQVLPVLIALKHILQQQKHPLMKLYRTALMKILKEYKSEINEVLVADPHLASEVQYDLSLQVNLKTQTAKQSQTVGNGQRSVRKKNATKGTPLTPIASSVLASQQRQSPSFNNKKNSFKNNNKNKKHQQQINFSNQKSTTLFTNHSNTPPSVPPRRSKRVGGRGGKEKAGPSHEVSDVEDYPVVYNADQASEQQIRFENSGDEQKKYPEGKAPKRRKKGNTKK